MKIVHLRERRTIGVIGASDASKEVLEMAEEVGFLLAEREAILICGGLGGVMQAACKGAKKGGGITIGVIPTYEKKSANEYVDIVIATGMGHSRNAIIAANADGLIAIGGNYGTLSEIAFGRKLGKPVMTLKSFEVRLDGKARGDILVADNPRHAVSRIWNILDEMESHHGK